MAKVIWTQRAINDLLFIETFLNQHSTAASFNFSERVLKRVDVLARFPESGSLIKLDQFTHTRKLSIGRYVVGYEIIDDDVVIRSIKHGAREDAIEDSLR